MSAIFLPCKILCMLEHGMRKKLRWIFLVICALKPVNMIYTKEPDHFYNYILQNRVTQSLSTHLQYTLRTTMALEFKAGNKKYFSSQHTWLHVARHHDQIMDRNLGRYLAECWQRSWRRVQQKS
jgi:phage-related protein